MANISGTNFQRSVRVISRFVCASVLPPVVKTVVFFSQPYELPIIDKTLISSPSEAQELISFRAKVREYLAKTREMASVGPVDWQVKWFENLAVKNGFFYEELGIDPKELAELKKMGEKAEEIRKSLVEDLEPAVSAKQKDYGKIAKTLEGLISEEDAFVRFANSSRELNSMVLSLLGSADAIAVSFLKSSSKGLDDPKVLNCFNIQGFVEDLNSRLEEGGE